MPYITVNGIDVYHEVGGSGPRCLFISGTGGDLRNRPNVFDGPLTDHFEVLAYDQRGLGRSGKPSTDYTMADYADDAAGLLASLDWPSVPVIGVSFGGMVAQELALRHPARVRALVLACTSAGGAGGASYPLHELEHLPEADRVATHLALADVRRDAAWRAAHPERWARLLELSAAGRRADRDPDGAARQLAARATHDTFDRLEALSLPVLVAGGEFDGVAPPENQRALAARIRGAQLRLFAGGHLFLVQDKSAYPFIIQWVSEQLKAA